MGQTPSSGADRAVSSAIGRVACYSKIEAYYQGIHQCLEESGQSPYRLTTLGAWAPSVPAHLYGFFQQLGLERQRLFVDLGSGDGLVVCVAGLFTQAVGIEIDRELCITASRAIADLNLAPRVSLICGDFRGQRIRNADCLYLYPDKPVADLEMLLSGWQGLLLIAGPHFPLQTFTVVERLAYGRDHLVAYRSRA